MTTLCSKYGRGEERIKIVSRKPGSKNTLRTLGMYDMTILKWIAQKYNMNVSQIHLVEYQAQWQSHVKINEHDVYLIIYKHLVQTSWKTNCEPFPKTKQLILLGQEISICCESYKTHKHNLRANCTIPACQVVHIVTTALLKVNAVTNLPSAQEVTFLLWSVWIQHKPCSAWNWSSFFINVLKHRSLYKNVKLDILV